ncbi:MAG: VWA domain-containing protein [Anaerolineales bacterium]|nr:VWA domain-containing protein [Anaerolineales bacterium]
MYRKLSLIITLCVVMISTNLALAFQGQSVLDGRPGQEPPAFRQSVFIKSHRVDVQIDNQIARTRVEQIFVNEGTTMAEGTYVFPLPKGVTVSDLVMYIDDIPIEGKILEKDEARAIYDQIVRSLRDPALLEYIGNDAIQANVFPIPAGDERKLVIEFNQLLPVESGIVHYVYPLRTRHISPLPVGELSIRVAVNSNDPISNIYSPTHPIAIDRISDTKFVAGFETSYSQEANDFSLYYGLANEDVNLNLLTYRESATEDGFFTLLVSPPVEVDTERVIPKDVIVVIDQSGSMYGDKWSQARDAAKYVLDNLNPEDRFNVVLFSTGVDVYGLEMQGLDEVNDAKGWLDVVEPIGGTNIDSALKTALEMADRERQTVILFLTDGLPTEGVTDIRSILENVGTFMNPATRIFAFGVGDDVDTFLLDQIAQGYRGASAYVRPSESIDTEVSTLYSKISSPLLTNLELAFDGIQVYDLYPPTLPDLFIGSQLVVVGRYRGDADNATVTLSGNVERENQSFIYSNLDFRANAGGEVLIPRLWATRKIGELLNAIRLNGENPELVDSIVRLSIRYGIITPYTSFLITEDDIFSQTGVERAIDEAEFAASDLADVTSGAGAVGAAEEAQSMTNADRAAPAPTSGSFGGDADDGYYDGNEAPPGEPGGPAPLQLVADRTFLYRDGTWIDTTYNADEMEVVEIEFLSDAYFDLLDVDERVAQFYALGEHIIFVLDDTAYEIVSAE